MMLPTLGNPDAKYKLRWNNGSSAELNLSQAFRELRENADLLDVSIACSSDSGGIKLLKAHKTILSIYSQVFKEMFNDQPKNKEPYIYLKGISFDEMSSILDFMYNGVVDISQTKLHAFLSVAEELQVKGLHVNGGIKNKDLLPKDHKSR